MNQYCAICRRRKTAFSVALALLTICGLLAALAPGVTASVHLLYFKATAGSDRILVEWETATEQNTLAFRLYRSQDSAVKGPMIGDTFQAGGDATTGANYSYTDTDVMRGVRYYYSLEELSSGGGVAVIATANAGIDVSPPTQHYAYLPVVLR
jgi:hypothetical protein